MNAAIAMAISSTMGIAPSPTSMPPLPSAYANPCQVSWQPNVFQPVVWGVEYIYKGTNNAPTNMMVIYPSMQIGNPYNPPPPLAGCGKFPVILFAHGVCDMADTYKGQHYKVWEQTLSPLARAGFVVVVPDRELSYSNATPTSPGYDDASARDLAIALYWLEVNWKWREILSNRMGIIGHSYGGAAALRYYYNAKTPKAIALLSPALEEAQALYPWVSQAITGLSIPSLHFFGSGNDLVSHGETQPDQTNRPYYWKYFHSPAHSVEFVGAGHYDYLATDFKCGYPPGSGTKSAACPLQWSLTADVLVMFFSKYLPPVPLGNNANIFLSNTLIPPTSLPVVGNDPEQTKFFSYFLKGRENFVKAGCSAVFRFKTPGEGVAFVQP
jgi:pimeloyl-ACP methyl ester carboxylesterase